MATKVILPVKRFERAKQRLAAALGSPERIALARAMLADVADALAETRSIESVLVVSAEPLARNLASERDLDVLPDIAEAGQSAATAAGLERARSQGFDRALLLPADCPLVDAHEIDDVVALVDSERLEAVVVPDRHGAGTNALVLEPAGPFQPLFGPGSLSRHVEQAQRLGLRHSVEAVHSLALDVDTAADLSALELALAREPGRGRHTRAALEAMPADERAPAVTAT
jgi:2-phospho-L-lactate/phosphoenolpyruvate guanylyltransferase